MRILIAPGDVLTVGIDDGDVEFTIAFDAGGNGHLTVSADMADSTGRVGVIYDEDFSQFADVSDLAKGAAPA